MNGFESFEVRSWLDGALTIWSPVQDQSLTPRTALPRLRNVMAAVALSASVTAMAHSGTTVAAPSNVATSSPAIAPVQLPAEQDGLPDAVPDGYWETMLTAMSAWSPVAADDDLALPPPAI